MIRRRSTIHTIAWFADQHRSNKLDLEPPYQRGDLVWSRDYQAFFIDTILRNYPAPAIFLHVETSKDGYTIYRVVDGKQRLTAIFEFIEGNFTVPKKYGKQEYIGVEFDDLSDNLKQNFWEYDLPVQEVPSSSEDALREAFDRLNRNVARLSKQELRHAAFAGEFATLIEQLTDEPFWGDIGISTRATAKRMKDIEFVSEIFLLTMHGVIDGAQSKILDNYYKEYDAEIPDRENHMRRYRACMRIFENLGVAQIKNSRFSNFSDFYSLWATFLKYADDPQLVNNEATIANLHNFDVEFATYVESPEKHQGRKDLITYYDNVRQGVNKSANRKNRAEILAKLIETKQ